MNRTQLTWAFQALSPGALGEFTSGGLLWDRGGTHSLDKLRHVPGLHLLVLCLEGRSDYIDITGRTAVLEPGDAMLIPRGLAHSYRPSPGHGWSEIYLWMRGSLPDLWWSGGFLAEGTFFFKMAPLMEWARRLCELVGRNPAGSFVNDERLALLQMWLSRFKVSQSQLPVGVAPAWFMPACQALESGTLREPGLESLARTLGVSYETFRKVFVASAGVSPGQFRAKAMVQQACRLLNEEGHTLKEIAEWLAFSDEFHFARVFRTHIGIPPGQYRKPQNRNGRL